MEIFGLCSIAMIPVRNTPAHSGELVTQLLFGELFKGIESKDNWIRVRGSYDQYEGWISRNNFQNISGEEFEKLLTSPFRVLCDPITRIQSPGSNEAFYIPGGSNIYSLEEDLTNFNMGGLQFRFLEEPLLNLESEHTDIKNLALKFLHTPYLWGGRTLMGIDCSGFSQLIYKMSGINLLRDASQQVNMGETINFLSSAKPGDLAFFDNEDGRIVHVGLLLSDSEIIHASGMVRIDRIDQHGIFNLSQQRYTHQLRIIKRLML